MRFPISEFEKGKTYYFRTRSVVEVYLYSNYGHVFGLKSMKRNVKYKDMEFMNKDTYPIKETFKSGWSEVVKYTVN